MGYSKNKTLAENRRDSLKHNHAWKLKNQDKVKILLKRKAARMYQAARKLCHALKIERGGCAHCPVKDFRILEWAHKHGTKKIKSPSQFHSFKRIIEEAKKCLLLCCNCHALYDRNICKRKEGTDWKRSRIKRIKEW